MDTDLQMDYDHLESPSGLSLDMETTQRALLEQSKNNFADSNTFFEMQGENYCCKLCDKVFNYKNGIIRHLRLTHGKEKPFECNICHRRFGYKNILMEHQNIHFGIKPYACTLCDKRFAARSNLVQHKMIHRKPFSCQICSKRFDKSEQLQRHLLGHPGGFLSCNLCNFITTTQLALNDHIQTNHHVLNTPEKASNTNEKTNKSSPDIRSSTPTSLMNSSPFSQSPMPNISHSISAENIAHLRNSLPHFAAAFNFDPSMLQVMESTDMSDRTSHDRTSNTESESMRKIDNICAHLASKTSSNAESPTMVDDIKQEPESPSATSGVSTNIPFIPVFPIAGRRSTRQNILNSQAHNASSRQRIESVNQGDSPSRNLQASDETITSASRSSPWQTQDQSGMTADSTSNLSEMIGLLQNLIQRQEQGISGPFPSVSVSLNPPRSTKDMGVQHTSVNQSMPGMKETLGYYESQGKLFRCLHCSIFFEERGLYVLHMSLHGRQSPWECAVCNKVCHDKNDFHLHMANQQH
ncbi:hypothetical protein ACJMK2_008153 [Sinanodonta woodiana]|uniref:C2H2-type domain-containing protein n=1 Tax=Sinanodonta woodiana TaxID=1069815 RepID=A0ABD3VLX6_SINWO